MLETLIILLIILWLLGFFTFHLGSAVHLLLVLILIVVAIRLVRGTRPLV